MIRLADAFERMPLIAILRGIRPEECEAVGEALVGAGFTMIEVPLNSPEPFRSIALLNMAYGSRVIIGAGTVLEAEQVEQVAHAGGRLIVSPNMDTAVIAHTKRLGLISAPGIATPSEGFAALKAGADMLKLFPGELVTPPVIKAMRAVFPAMTRMVPVGGISADTMKVYAVAGASGFGIGSSLYKPGLPPDEIRTRADAFVQAWRVLQVSPA